MPKQKCFQQLKKSSLQGSGETPAPDNKKNAAVTAQNLTPPSCYYTFLNTNSVYQATAPHLWIPSFKKSTENNYILRCPHIS